MNSSNSTFASPSHASRVQAALEAHNANNPLLGKDTLFAIGEQHLYESHEIPQQALQAVVSLLHGIEQGDHQARHLGGVGDGFNHVQPGQLAYLLAVISDRLDTKYLTQGDMALLRERMAAGEVGGAKSTDFA